MVTIYGLSESRMVCTSVTSLVRTWCIKLNYEMLYYSNIVLRSNKKPLKTAEVKRKLEIYSTNKANLDDAMWDFHKKLII